MIGIKSLRAKILIPLICSIASGIFVTFFVTMHKAGGSLPEEVKKYLYVFYSVFGILWILIVILLVIYQLAKPFRRLGDLTNHLENMAQGHLMVSNHDPSGDEISMLSSSMSEMTLSLNKTLNSVIISANKLFSAGTKLDDNAGKFANNAGMQSEKAHQMATAAEEMSQTIDEIARNAADASETSCNATEIVREGKFIAESAVETAQRVLATTSDLASTIDKLNASILEIGAFVTVVEEIADQTNLLALNAAIEAARSGEHGRGFAVVADEVRNLASRTIRATTEISAKISAVQTESVQTAKSMKEASAGVTKTTDSIQMVGKSLDQILEAFQRVNDQVTQMATAIEEQSATTHEVASSIENTSTLSSEMGAMAGEVANEVKVLGGIADELLVEMGTLRLDAHRKTQKIIEKFASSQELLSMERNRQEAFLKKMTSSYPFIELLYITDENGRQITSNISAAGGFSTTYGNDGFHMNWSNRPWFIGAKKSKDSFVTDLYRSAATNTFCYTVACILVDERHRVKGVLGADIDFQQFCSFDKAG